MNADMAPGACDELNWIHISGAKDQLILPGLSAKHDLIEICTAALPAGL
jgi:hypothetical protein